MYIPLNLLLCRYYHSTIFSPIPQKEVTPPPPIVTDENIDKDSQGRNRSNTNPTITVVTSDGTSNQVQLRLPSDSDDKDIDRRKSGVCVGGGWWVGGCGWWVGGCVGGGWVCVVVYSPFSFCMLQL